MRLLRLPTPWRRHLAAALAVLVFGIALLSTAPGLHEQLHADANDSEHSCAITLFAAGLTSAAVGIVLAVVAGVVSASRRTCTTEPAASPAALLPPVRGPPAT